MSELAIWQSHKKVAAGKIRHIAKLDTGWMVTVENAIGGCGVVEVDAKCFARGMPILGDYLVIYDDGYTSWSPAKAFEDGYTREA